jgi:hypothetical protein
MKKQNELPAELSVAEPEKKTSTDAITPSTDKIARRLSISQVIRRDSLLKDPYFTQSVSGSPKGNSWSVEKWPEHDKTKPMPDADISNLKKRDSKLKNSFFAQSSSSSPNIFAFDENLGPDSDKTKPTGDVNTEHDPVCGGKV